LLTRGKRRARMVLCCGCSAALGREIVEKTRGKVKYASIFFITKRQKKPQFYPEKKKSPHHLVFLKFLGF